MRDICRDLTARRGMAMLLGMHHRAGCVNTRRERVAGEPAATLTHGGEERP